LPITARNVPEVGRLIPLRTESDVAELVIEPLRTALATFVKSSTRSLSGWAVGVGWPVAKFLAPARVGQGVAGDANRSSKLTDSGRTFDARGTWTHTSDIPQLKKGEESR
jgi:hypothetical protein